MGKAKLIHLQGVGPILLERSARARKLGITVRPFAHVRVAVPGGVSFAAAQRAAQAQADWIRKHVAKAKEMEAKSRLLREAARDLDPDRARGILAGRLARLAVRHGYSFNRLTIRNQKTRWGSCSVRNNISLNMRLVLLPDDLRDYIILHELVHTRVKNHGRRFWQEMLRVEPRARELAAELRKLAI